MRADSDRHPGQAPAVATCFGPGNSLLGLVGPGLRPTSAAVYRRDVAGFLGWWRGDPAEVGPEDVARYLEASSAGPASEDRRRAAIGHFFRVGVAAGLWPSDPTAGLAKARRGAWRERTA